ncbi:MAG: hypothetical protein FWC70_08165 [Defluviitaleaceae bacterium]|nr:hypothetical protein [Defluviitaleaceae bacterium]
MTLKDFEQLIYMKSEIDVLNKRLRRVQDKRNLFVGDTAKDYRSGQGKVITIQGYAVADQKKIDEIWLLLEARKIKLEQKVLDAEKFIASLDCAKIRTLLTLRFIEGKEWQDVGKGFYKKMSADSARKYVKAYFEGA